MASHRLSRAVSRCTLEGLETRRLLAFGKTDTAFGEAGRATASIANATQTQQAQDLITTTGGKVVAAGDAGLVRFDSGGAVDETFGDGGTVRLTGLSFKAETSDGAGNVYVLGFGIAGPLVLKYTSAGAPDNSFGTRGSAKVLNGDEDSTSAFRAVSIAVQGDGKIVVGGTLFGTNDSGDVQTSKSRVYRLNTNGTIDATFGTNGAADVQLGQAPLLQPDLHDKAMGVVVLGSGKIMLAGGSYSSAQSFEDPDGNFVSESFGPSLFAVARLNADGTLDNTFGSGGVSRSIFADVIDSAKLGGVLPTAVGIQSDGTVFLGTNSGGALVTKFTAGGTVAFTARPNDGSPLSTPVDLTGLTGGRIAVLARGSFRNEYGFVIATIDSAGNFSNDIRTDDLNDSTPDLSESSAGALAVASNGRLLIGGEGGDGFLVGAYSQGTAADPRPDDFAHATVNDIIKDNTGALHLAYFDTKSKSLHYAYRAPNGLWNPSVEVDSKSNTGTFISIALHDVNKGTDKKPIIVQEPAIAYFVSSTADLKLAESVDLGAHWTLQVIATKGSVGRYPTLFYDSKNRATVSFYNLTTGDAVFGQLKDGKWGFETIDSAGDVGRDIVLDVDPNGSYAVAYADTTNKTVKYAVQGKKGIWSSQVADSTTGGAKYISLDHSSDFGPAISYFDIAAEDLNFAYFRKGKWKRQSVATTGTPGLFSRVQFRSSFGNPTIYAWSSFPNRVVQYTNIVPGPVPQTVFSGGGQFLTNDWDGTQQDFAFLDTSSNQLHVRTGPSPDT